MNKVKAIVKRFTIDPDRDIAPNIPLFKILNIEARRDIGCFNCGDKCNQEWLKTTAWAGVQYCWACDSLNVVSYADQMGGNYLDEIRCYNEQGENARMATDAGGNGGTVVE